MASGFTFTVHVALERESGKFMSRDEMEEILLEAIEAADPDTVEGGADGGSIYTVEQWDVTA